MTIIIIGITHHNTLSMVRCFGQRGVKVDLILHGNTENSYVAESSYIRKVYKVHSAEDAIFCLVSEYGHSSEMPIVISSSDEIESLLDMKFEELCTKYLFFNCGKQGRVTELMNKLLQTELAENAGLEVPKSQVVDITSRSVAIDFFPCILKPLESIHGGKKISICKNKKELNKCIAQDFENGDRVLLQQYINKEEEIVVVGLSVSGDILIPAYVQKHRETKGATAYATVRDIARLPENVVRACKQLVIDMKYEGLFGIELMKSSNSYYFCEINLRNDATTYAVSVAGVNLPYIYMLAKQGRDYSNELREIRELDSMVELNDFRNVLKRKVTPIKWWSEYKKCGCLYFKDPNDMNPYHCMRKEFCKSIIKKILHVR